jgi:hypothetical protein
MRAPAHVHVAVRLLDRCGVSDAMVGDLLEQYETLPSAVRLWREVAVALLACIGGYLRDNKPQTIRRTVMALAIFGLFGYSLAGEARVNLAASVRVEKVSGGWHETTAGNGMTRLLPTVSFTLRNVSDMPLSSVQVNVLFRRRGDNQAWSDVFRRAITSRGLEAGASTGQIVAQSPVGYTGDEATSRLLTHSHFVDTAVAIYARHGSDQWTYLGEYPLPRHIVRANFSPAAMEHRNEKLRLK